MSSRRWPAPLQPGSVVTVVAPSGPYDAARLARGVEVISDWGLQVRLSTDLPAVHDELAYLAGADAARAAELTAAWCDPETDAVWAARGGYGAQRMVDLVDYDALRAAGPKMIIGFSDITALHTRIGRELDQVTIHGPIAAGVEQWQDGPTADSVRRLIMAPPRPGTELARGVPVVPGAARGRLVGGNLALVASDIGVEPLPDEPVVALFEDIAEEGYRVDRMITQLVRSGWFDQVVGVIIGDFTEPGEPNQVPATLTDLLHRRGIPVLDEVPVGHGPRNLALPLGAEVIIADGALTLA